MKRLLIKKSAITLRPQNRQNITKELNNTNNTTTAK